MSDDFPNLLVVLGPTASGKTRVGVSLARALGGEIVSADSRQVYRGLNIGAGKDLGEYSAGGAPVPYHLIDIADLDEEFSVFHYQKRFFEVFEDLSQRHVLPILVGGTGLYIDAVLKGYRMVEAPEDPEFRARCGGLTTTELVERLRVLKPELHNTTDMTDRTRIVRAIEIAEYSQTHEPEPAPDIRPVVLGLRWPREELHRRIRLRLKERLDNGLVEEVASLHAQGVAWEKLDFLGLEYRFIASHLRGEMNRNDMAQRLATAICQFAKRQETWFRRMERLGTPIHWIDRASPDAAIEVARSRFHLIS
ncbi:MAG: tRNA (adenosine(37)-N6)-dimethylallyltransferase MiaA [Candidatus Hydrogenedentes bacterium]|nr:tRNA (adenosine(37)-N6)-dimethylallyltransferase MiaA [Candidatus Hydrogenedentota bacterium]